MIKIKTSEAIGPALDWLVATAECRVPFFASGYIQLRNWIPGKPYSPSTDPDQAYSIIFQERISVINKDYLLGTKHGEDGPWMAYRPNSRLMDSVFAFTPLIAAMRCYVASKLGDEVEVPEELVK